MKITVRKAHLCEEAPVSGALWAEAKEMIQSIARELGIFTRADIAKLEEMWEALDGAGQRKFFSLVYDAYGKISLDTTARDWYSARQRADDLKEALFGLCE